MMNYFSFSPNFALQLQQSPQGFSARQHLPLQAILSTLSLALTNSIANYQNASQTRNSPSQPFTTLQSPSSPTKTPLLPSDSSPPIQTEIQLTVQKQNKGNPEEKAEASQLPSQVNPKSSQPIQKTQQRIEQKVQPSLTGREQNNKKRLEDPVKVDTTKTLPVPSVDLVETAYLRVCGMEDAVLGEKRNDLLGRRVDEWSEKSKSRRDKRELRLLQN